MRVPEVDSLQRRPHCLHDRLRDVNRLTRKLMMLRERLQHFFLERLSRLCVHPVHASRRGNEPSLNEIEVDDRDDIRQRSQSG